MVRSHNVWFKNPQWTELIDQIALGHGNTTFCAYKRPPTRCSRRSHRNWLDRPRFVVRWRVRIEGSGWLIYKKTRFDLVADPYYGCFKLLPKKDKRHRASSGGGGGRSRPATAEPALAEAAAEADKVEDESLNPFESKSASAGADGGGGSIPSPHRRACRG